MPSVLQEWVEKLPLRAQGTLLTGVRCCDDAPNHPPVLDEYDSPLWNMSVERQLHAFLRFCVLVPADRREVDVPGAWLQSQPPREWRASQLGHYPLHWYSHLMHCFEVISYLHPDHIIRSEAEAIYLKLVHNLHLRPEEEHEMLRRLKIDRIATGEVVS